MREAQDKNAPSQVSKALAAFRGAALGIALLSGMSNILMLTGALFMLEVYDRVLPSRSIPTLIGLSILAAGLFLAQGIVDWIRGRILVRIGGALDESLGEPVYASLVRLPLIIGNRDGGWRRYAISMRCDPSCRARVQWRYLICRGCRSICSSVISCIPGSVWQRCSARSC